MTGQLNIAIEGMMLLGADFAPLRRISPVQSPLVLPPPSPPERRPGSCYR